MIDCTMIYFPSVHPIEGLGVDRFVSGREPYCYSTVLCKIRAISLALSTSIAFHMTISSHRSNLTVNGKPLSVNNT